MLKNSSYSYTGIFVPSGLSQISQAERRLASKKQALEDIQNEYELIEKQAFNTYIENISYFQLSQKGYIDKSMKWLAMKNKNQDADGNKLDGRKSYPEKTIFEYYTNYLKELLGIEYMKDMHFYDYNFGDGCHISFEYKDHIWQLDFPYVENVKFKSYQSHGASIFKLRLLHKDRDMVWSQVGATFEEDELKDIMAQGIEKYCSDISKDTN